VFGFVLRHGFGRAEAVFGWPREQALSWEKSGARIGVLSAAILEPFSQG